MRRYIKSLLGRLVFWTGLHKRFFRDKALVVVFHRVDDGLGHDPISCTHAAFNAYCDFFKRFFVVVSLEELLERLETGRDVGRHLAITFDDGYRDNHDVAAVELKRRQLPACFFITTDFIGSDRVPEWDAAKGIASAWMNWDQVRSLSDQGFEVGAHTMSHVDLGTVEGDEVVLEVTGSLERLERETGKSVRYFAYPFGGMQNITPQNLAAIRSVGFRCCLAAYGGAVTAEFDPWYLERLAVSPWYVSPYHFGFEALFERPIKPLPKGGPQLSDDALPLGSPALDGGW